MPDAPRPPGGSQAPWMRLVRLCLLAWPAERRRAHGASLLGTMEALLRGARSRGRLVFVRELVGEGMALVATGVAMRGDDLRRSLSDGATGCLADARFALRTLRRDPAFTFVAVATLALGIGANAAVFALVDGVLLRAPPYRDHHRLVLVWNTLPGSSERIPVAGPDAAILRERAERLAAVAFVTREVNGSIAPDGGEWAEHVRLAEVTPELFRVLGVEPALGRGFGPQDAAGPGAATAEGAATVALLSDGAWRRIFGADSTILRRTVRLNGLPVRVVGVLPPRFHLELPPDVGMATDIDVWTPLLVPLSELHRDERLLDQDSDNSGAVIARLAPGATVAQARAEARRIAEGLRAEVPAYRAAGLDLDVRPLHADATAHARRLLLALLAGAGIVLAVACLSIAGLVLARGMTRSGELAVRAALGAGRGRILRQLLLESLVLVAVGSLPALVLAHGAVAVLVAVVPPSLSVQGGLALELPTLAFGGAAAAVAATLAGLLPARWISSVEARRGVAPALARHAPGPGWARRSLVVAEVALSVVLVLGAGLLLRTVRSLQEVRPGFEPEGALTFNVSMRAPGRYASPARRAELMHEIAARLSALPGVREVGYVGGLPLAGERWTQPYGLPGQARSEWASNRADFRVISSGYFAALGSRLLEGRTFTPGEDVAEEERVVMVDEKLAHRIAPGRSALGAVVGVPVDGAAIEARIVGVVENIRYEALESDGREAVYVPYRQEASRDVSFVVRTTGAPVALAPEVRSAVRQVDAGLPVHDLRTLDAYVAEAVAPRRFALLLLVAFAGLALVCAAVGLYGVVAFDVSRRTRDIGLRLAVGARPREVVRWVIRSGLRLGAVGLAVGVVLAMGAAAGLRSLVFGVGVFDPSTWVGALALVTAVILLACWLPARRASRMDPTAALRSE